MVIRKYRPQSIRHREGAMLKGDVGETRHHSGDPDIGGLFAAARASPTFAALVNNAPMGAMGILTAKFFATHERCAAGQHFGDSFDFNRPQWISV